MCRYREFVCLFVCGVGMEHVDRCRDLEAGEICGERGCIFAPIGEM